MQNPILAIVIPCFNEQDLIKSTINSLLCKIKELSNSNIISDESFLYFIDDGSHDETWNILQKSNQENSKVKALKLSRNFGNQNALLAGLLGVQALNPDCVITMDADLQQDENSIKEFIEKYKNGADIVCGIRKDNETYSIFKNCTSVLFYKLMNLMGAKIAENHSDYRLINKKVLNVLAEYKEVNLFLRGIFNELGFKTEHVYFDVKPRAIGQSKFGILKLLSLALSGITSFSIVPLRIVSVIGLLMSFFSFLMGVEVIYEKVFGTGVIPGWATIVVAVCFIGGVQIFCTGIIGEYLGQVYKETKARPRYVKDIELL
ncbi:MAG: glycosyltransferase family 2 protein [bacterium]